jgi:putative FmdB family regulatory protein
MPTYDYRCNKCGYEGEYSHSMKARIRLDCPVCVHQGSTSRLVRKVSAPHINTGRCDDRTILVQDLPCGHKFVQRTDADSVAGGFVNSSGVANIIFGTSDPQTKVPEIMMDICRALRESERREEG